ncbi:MAG: UDP-N-acetylglucosamine 2-epimerase (non-hydrolyzing) [Bacteroides sp.]|nr:UDP-N-acetylglucosamine 2-epimerase (non-hydrolyzing) [Prevotella sp.]MCM1407373.1 UDP-N-acetylglucosamine 2-epimerase (non-hydrolyzing) [Treponema brennaborense]MCM1469863.1 UDP-N-acetylglucosamine 2-epimerase (non-hydrolyzing) [Bacteroides sp.]
MKKILFIYGTRPEAIKMAPLIKEFQKHPLRFKVAVCLTGQHRQMLDQINSFFGIKGDYDLNLMKPNQTLFDIVSGCLLGLKPILESEKPDLIFVQGDTSTVLAGALASYFCKLPIAHLEAGLRSGDKYSPFPEEGNRILAGHIADFHFCPTERAAENLRREGIPANIYMVGNTVIDALHLGLALIKKKGDKEYSDFFSYMDFSKKIVLITGHRRENFGSGFENICKAISVLADKHNDTEFIYPMHLNPNVREPVMRHLHGKVNIHLIEPLDYPYLIWLMEKCFFVLTDSGGIQEEAPALGKPVLVMRDVTERQEGVEAGTAKLVGTDCEKIVSAAEELLCGGELYKSMSNAVNPYGDGKTSERIVKILENGLL